MLPLTHFLRIVRGVTLQRRSGLCHRGARSDRCVRNCGGLRRTRELPTCAPRRSRLAIREAVAKLRRRSSKAAVWDSGHRSDTGNRSSYRPRKSEKVIALPRGLDAHVKHFQELQEKTRSLVFHPFEIVAAQRDRVGVYFNIDAEFSDGRKAKIFIAGFFRLRDMKIVNFTEIAHFEGDQLRYMLGAA